MIVSKYKKPLIIYFVYNLCIIPLALLSFGFHDLSPLSPFIPTNYAFIEALLLILVYFPLLSILGVLIGNYLGAPVFLFFHKKFIGTKNVYGIWMKSNSTQLKIFSKGIFPALITINFSLMLYRPEVLDFVMEYPSYAYMEFFSAFTLIAILFLSSLTFIFANLLFSSSWGLIDSGIVHTNKKQMEDLNAIPKIRASGEWFSTLLKGYAGIGVIFSYIQFSFQNLSNSDYTSYLSFLLNMIIYVVIMIVIVLILILATIPGLILSDILGTRKSNYVRNIGKKMGIVDILEISIDLKKIK